MSGHSGILGDILVVGGGSRIAAALAPLLGDAAIYVGRRPTGRGREIVVADYCNIPHEVMVDVRCVINCVGVSTGDAAHLTKVNVAVARELAIAAKRVGVGHMIHISSFSVYGQADTVGQHTPTAPASDYGRSKLAADNELLALADNRFAVTVLRLPLIYAHGSMGKLGQLLRTWQRVGIFPVPAGDVARAMIGVELSAETIVRLIAAPQTGVVFSADPKPFTYTGAARARAGGEGPAQTLRQLTVPRAVTKLIERVAPTVGGRLFADCRLADADNLAVRYGLASRLHRDIATADLG